MSSQTANDHFTLCQHSRPAGLASLRAAACSRTPTDTTANYREITVHAHVAGIAGNGYVMDVDQSEKGYQYNCIPRFLPAPAKYMYPLPLKTMVPLYISYLSGRKP